MLRSAFSGFIWDSGNREKCEQHGVPLSEIEYVLTHAETLIMPDLKNSQSEARFLAVGRTSKRRYTFVVFTPRRSAGATLLRPLSARYMHRKEIEKYEQEITGAQKR